MQEVTSRDLVLNPNEFAFVLDKTKGGVTVYVGPKQASLSQTDQLVIFNEGTKRFSAANLDQAVQTFCTAPEGWYITLKNPASNRERPHPGAGNANHLEDLNVGCKIHLQGPKSFALWPGQMARVVKGHNLRSNQYLTVRVYDDDAAMKNWGKAVMKPQADTSDTSDTSDIDDAIDTPITDEVPTLTMGQLLVIKGTDVSFYIPPTGVEVVPDGKGKYVRDAVTLETLEYTILLSEDGNKRFLRGPAVVFPEPTEVFVGNEGARKYKAIELNELQGIYLKVTTPYAEKDGTGRREGEELFITGKDQMIYFPRAEHAIIMRDGRKKHYAIAIPEGEARYVLDREKGKVSLEMGPKMFLPDPRKQIIVRRMLPEKIVNLLYPGNREAMEHNQVLRAILQDTGAGDDEMLRESMMRGARGKRNLHGVGSSNLSSSNAAMAYSNVSTSAMDTDWQEASGQAVSDEFHRQSGFTPPQTITIDSKYDGAVTVNLWTGYAMLLVRRSGERRVVEGPQAVRLQYDEIPEILTMSTGKPKTTDNMFQTVYLRTKNNKISDIIKAETKDMCTVQVKVSHRVDFTGDDVEKWFGAENYVKILCDHVRSIVRKVAKNFTLKEFYANVEDIIRDAVLGTSEVQEDGETERKGRTFAENNMKIYDIEVLSTRIGDERIADLLTRAQHEVVEQTLRLEAEIRKEDISKQRAEINKRMSQLNADNEKLEIVLAAEKEQAEATKQVAHLESMKVRLTLEQETAESAVARDKLRSDYDAALDDAELARQVQELEAKTISEVQLADAVNDDLVAALNTFGDKMTLKEITQAMAPMSYIGDISIAGALERVLGNTRLAGVLGKQNGNGDTRGEEKKTRRDKRREDARTDW